MKVKNLFFLFLSLFLIFYSFALGAEIETHVDTSGPSTQQVLTYHGPKARIAVASFKCKAAKCDGAIGDGIADMLATALFRTGRFIVLERGEGFKAVKEELDLSQSGYIRPGAAPQKGQMEGADILVVGAITAFEPEASGIKGGGLAIPFKVPLLGGIKVGKKEAYIAADIRLIDVRTGRVINAATVEGKASSWNIGGLGGGIFGDIALGGGLEVYKNTPMEKAIRVMLNRAVDAIAKMVPENYYRWGANTGISQSQQVAQAQPPQPQIQGGTKPQSPQIIGSGRPASGGIISGADTFIPGKKVLFKEDFSEYQIGDIPTSFDSLKGQVEVAGFNGQKWLRALSEEVSFMKKINLPANFAIEYDIYFSGKYWGVWHACFLGHPRAGDTPDTLFWASDWEYARWSNQEIKTIKIRAGEIHHFAIQQKNGKIRIYIDGRRAYQGLVEGGISGKLPNRDAVSFRMGGANPSEHKEILISNIKITAY